MSLPEIETVSSIKNIIKTKSNDLSYDDRLNMLKILQQYLPASKIIENADGCRINLDSISIEIINTLYHLIKTKRKN
jgi:tRNA(Ser,Leu) C12 N-acetylase TAN1